MKEKMRKFMDEPLTMRRCLKMTAISYGVALAACAVWYGVERAKVAWFEHKWDKKNHNEIYTEDVE